jgi:hypothetical protein
VFFALQTGLQMGHCFSHIVGQQRLQVQPQAGKDSAGNSPIFVWGYRVKVLSFQAKPMERLSIGQPDAIFPNAAVSVDL